MKKNQKEKEITIEEVKREVYEKEKLKKQYLEMREDVNLLKEREIDPIKGIITDIKKEVTLMKNEQNRFFINLIEVLSIFVVIIGFIFSSVQFSIKLYLTHAIILIGFVFLLSLILIISIHKIVRI